MNIEKGIPVPARRKTRWAKTADRMQIGSSVLVLNQTEATGLCWALKSRGKRTRQERQKGGRVRVWVIE